MALQGTGNMHVYLLYPLAFLFLLWGSQLFTLTMTPKERKSSFFSFSPSFLIRKSEVARGGRMCRYQEVKKWSDDFRAAFPLQEQSSARTKSECTCKIQRVHFRGFCTGVKCLLFAFRLASQSIKMNGKMHADHLKF